MNTKRAILVLTIASTIAGAAVAQPKPAAGAPAPQQLWQVCSAPGHANALAACNALLARKDLNAAQRADTFHRRGMIQRDRNAPAAAIGDLNEAIKLAPANAVMLNDRGFILAAQNRLDEAIQDFARATQRNPQYAEAFYNLGLAYYFKGDMAKSIANYDRIVSMRKDAFAALGNRCLSKTRLGADLAAARSDCEAALRVQPNHAMNLAIRGTVRFKQGDLAGARNDCDSAITLSPQFGWPYALRAAIKAKAGDAVGARPDAAAGVRFDPAITQKLAQLGVTVPAALR